MIHQGGLVCSTILKQRKIRCVTPTSRYLPLMSIWGVTDGTYLGKGCNTIYFVFEAMGTTWIPSSFTTKIFIESNYYELNMDVKCIEIQPQNSLI